MLPAQHTLQADSLRDGKPKAALPLSYLLLESRAAVELRLCMCRAVWKCLAILEVHNLCLCHRFLRGYSLYLLLEQRLVPEWVVQVEVVSSHLWWSLSPPDPTCGTMQPSELQKILGMVLVHTASNDPQRQTSHGLVLSCDLGASACV